MDKLREELKQLAAAQMINEIRFIGAEALEPAELFRGRQPQDLMPGAKSLIIAGVYIGGFRLPVEEPDIHARMSRLTLAGFYWNVVEPLEALREHLISRGFDAIIYNGLTEENSIPLKPAAVKAGLGWQGKNTLLLNRKYGSFQALGGIVTNADLAEEYPLEEPRCGECTACISICPGNAIEPQGLNRGKCLSNLLEEDNMPEAVREMPDNYFFECDICQDVCPWNQKHLNEPLKTEFGDTFTQKDELLELFRFENLLSMDEDAYNEKILPLLTGVKLPYELFRRNVMLAWNGRGKTGGR